jgi:septum formation protein
VSFRRPHRRTDDQRADHDRRTDDQRAHHNGRTDDRCRSATPIVGPTMSAPRLVLASASPRRSDLLTTLGLRFTVRAADVDESVLDGEGPAAYVERVARAKAAAIGAIEPDAVVIAADTTVVLDEHILGKPADTDDARSMLRRLAGRDNQVLTAVVVASGPEVVARVAATTVTFATMTEADIDWYVATGEVLDKAGAYAIQGSGGLFVTRVDGSYHNVVGLPLDTLRELVADLGFDLLAWSR